MHRKEFIQKMQQVLLRRRSALRQSLSGELSQFNISSDRHVGDEIDAALDTDYGLINANLAEVESQELANIDAALERIREGTYGICEGCEKRIPVARLQAIPYARLCVKCQQEQDKLGGANRSATTYGAWSHE